MVGKELKPTQQKHRSTGRLTSANFSTDQLRAASIVALQEEELLQAVDPDKEIEELLFHTHTLD